MSELLKISISPYTEPFYHACGVNISPFVPYDNKSVTIKVDSNTKFFDKDGSSDNITKSTGVEVSNVIYMEDTEDTKTLSINLKESQSIEIDGKEIEFKLMNIGKENLKGQDFVYWEIFVSEKE